MDGAGGKIPGSPQKEKKMRTLNIAFTWFFSLLAIAAFLGALFMDAPHHFFTAGMCLILAYILHKDGKRNT